MKMPIYQLPGLSAENLPYLNMVLTRLAHAINNIEFGNTTGNENIWCTFVVVDTCSAGEVASASHSLNRAPLGTICVWRDAAGTLYKPTDATSADTEDQVFYVFDTDVPSAVLLLI